MATPRKLLVTHHAPDLDAIGAVWLLKRFDAQHYANAKVAFVNPGDQITYEEAQELGFQMHEVTHVDTGLGEFDHHQPERGHEHICATSLVFEHVKKVHPDLKNDETLATLAEFVTEIDHFGEIEWPEAEHYRYKFMIQELIHGMEYTDPHNDDSQLHFGMQCLDNAYAALEHHLKAAQIIDTEGQTFTLPIGECLALESSNDDTVKLAQKQGFKLVIRKDPKEGHIRVKARPDTDIDLKPLADAITKIDKKGSWYYHPSGKMLINGSSKHRNQVASPLSVQQIMELLQEVYT